VVSLLSFYAFALGAIVGSFLNVVIYRYPREESIVFPGSHCPWCGAAIRWFDNIPIVSFLVLRARCRACRAPISWRYPLVELANALFYLAIFLRTGPTLPFLPLAAIVSMTLLLIFIDLDIQILPDVIDIPGIAIALGMAALHLGDRLQMTLAPSLSASVIGGVAGAGVLLAIGETYKLLRRMEGMGLGDVKMLAMIGCVVGWQWLFGVLMIASVSGAVIGIALVIRFRSDLKIALPFGAFLGLSSLGVMYFGDTLYAWLPTLRWGS
jgi:leader peptidase (prepilin peptidase) / N-methyltransferase